MLIIILFHLSSRFHSPDECCCGCTTNLSSLLWYYNSKQKPKDMPDSNCYCRRAYLGPSSGLCMDMELQPMQICMAGTSYKHIQYLQITGRPDLWRVMEHINTNNMRNTILYFPFIVHILPNKQVNNKK
jgi:hypothetical protein